jgi:hypothetical protein
MKTLLKSVFILVIILSWFTEISYVNASDTTNLTTWDEQNSIIRSIPLLNELKNVETDIAISNVWWQKWIRNTLIRIARDLKNLFFIIASIYFLVLVIKLLFSNKTDEAVTNFKKWIIWISIWIIITQISYYFINVLFDENINLTLANNFIDVIINPLIDLLRTAASFFFLAIMIYSFFRIITANWDEEKAKSWKMTVLYATMWFIVIKIATALVKSIYWTISTHGYTWSSSVVSVDIWWFADIVVRVINWTNGFIWIVVVIMIIYAGFLTLTSAWDEEKFKKAKSIIIYIIIWLLVLVTNYLILTFFIFPEVEI